MSTEESRIPVNRPLRFESHALAEVKTSPWNPFAIVSAVLLDVSWQGFKIEFLGPVKCRPGSKMTMNVPLSPFGITVPTKMKLTIVIKWFDARNLRAGGIFEPLDSQQSYVMEKIIDKLAEERKIAR